MGILLFHRFFCDKEKFRRQYKKLDKLSLLGESVRFYFLLSIFFFFIKTGTHNELYVYENQRKWFEVTRVRDIQGKITVIHCDKGTRPTEFKLTGSLRYPGVRDYGSVLYHQWNVGILFRFQC